MPGCTTSCPAAKEFDNVLAYYADASTVEDKAFARNLHDALPEHLRPERAPVRGFFTKGTFFPQPGLTDQQREATRIEAEERGAAQAALFHGTEVPQHIRDAHYHAFLSGATANYVPSADRRQFGYEDRDGNWHPMAASSKERYCEP